MDRSVLKSKQVSELREIAEALQLTGYKSLKKADLIDLIANGADKQAAEDEGDSADDTDDDGRDDDERESSTSADRVRARRRAGRGDDEDSSGDGGGQRRERQRTRNDGDRGRDDDRQRGGNDNGGGRGDDNDGDDQGNRNRNRSRNRRRGRAGDVDLDELEVRQGVLDLLPEGYGFLRTTGYLSGELDVYVSQSFVRRNQLRRGDVLAGPIRYNKGNDKFPALARIDSIESEPYDEDERPEPRANFSELTAVHADERLDLDGDDAPAAMRLLDVLAPIGRGQRGLIVAPPRSGKTTLLTQLANAITDNHEDVHVMVLLVDERPEDVTEFARSTDAEVIASTFDRTAEDHTQMAELTIERAKRIVEHGRDVVLLVDSVTRLTRAWNHQATGSGRTLPGGLDASAVHPVKRLLATARKVEEGGSLTILATVSADTGSQLDDTILEEFASTGNSLVRLDPDLVVQGLFPPIDVVATSTRRADLLLDDDELDVLDDLRADLAGRKPDEALELLLDKVADASSSADVLKAYAKSGLD